MSSKFQNNDPIKKYQIRKGKVQPSQGKTPVVGQSKQNNEDSDDGDDGDNSFDD